MNMYEWTRTDNFPEIDQIKYVNKDIYKRCCQRENFCYDNYKRKDAADDEGGVDIELISDDDLIIQIRELTFHF